MPRSSREARQGGADPPPPQGLPPPRPPGLQLREDRSRLVRFDRPPQVRSLSCDDALGRVRHAVGDEEPEADVAHPGIAGRPHQGHNILVAVRCRPLHTQEAVAGGKAIIKVMDRKTVVLEDPQITAADDYLRINKSKERRYAFDQAFDETVATRQVYENTTRFLIGSVLQGFNATVFAYGATGAGKTHTMLGRPDEPGIMMLTLLDLFSEVASQKEARHFEVKCSFLEVYNENIRDLLRPDADYLDIREDPVKGMCVAGISEVGGLESADEIMSLLHQANRYRTTESTGANVTSSRSHAVLQVVVEQRDRTAGIVAQVNLGKLSMIDLAGSERASQTNNKGLRMIEGANINRSLLALGNCITALSSAVAFVPYRDSKMTRLLKDSLGGNCRTVMIANVSPLHVNYEDTHNTLKYANRAKNIKTKAVRNVVRETCHVSKYTEIIKDLRGEISELKTKLASVPENVSGSLGGAASDLADDVLEFSVDGANWKQELMQNFEERVRIKRRLIDLAHKAQNQLVQKSQAQVGISQWESAQIKTHSDEPREPEAEEPENSTPQSIRDLQEKLQSLKTEMARTEETTHALEQQLVENHQKAEKLQAELPRRVQNKDMRAFLGLVSRIYVMEVENMDMQEMNDVTAPLLHQKDLEAEALRIQIQMRDKIIEDQDRMLLEQGEDVIPRPDSWMDALPQPARRSFSPVRWGDEEERGRGGSDDIPDFSQPPGADGRRSAEGNAEGIAEEAARLLQHQPRKRAVSEGPPQVLPPISPTGRPSLVRAGAPDSAHGRGISHSPAPSGVGSTPPPDPSNVGSAPGSAAATSEQLTDGGVVVRPLDVAGRGLGPSLRGLPPRSPSFSSQGPAQHPSAPSRPAGTTPVAGDDGREALPNDAVTPEGDHHDDAGLPVVQGVHAMPPDRRAPLDAGGPIDNRTRLMGGGPIGSRRSRKKNRRGDPAARALRERDRESPTCLHVEASGLRRGRDDIASQGSDSEREHPSARGEAVAPRASAADRKGIIDKLNRKMKPGSARAGGPKQPLC